MTPDFLTLSQLNNQINREIKNAFPDTYWVMAETSDVRYNKNGHCYLELIEKKSDSGTILAKARSYIWSTTFQMLKPYFEAKTGQAFVSGIKVLVKVSVDFHPVYGFGLNVVDIDPTYTLGDIQRRRQEILDKLQAEGVLTLNKELTFPLNAQRVAVITSATAAGYEDFLDHLMNNRLGLTFYPHLFPAVMQGEQTESSIIQALEKIYSCVDLFDAVVIIRGGGASSDLTAFDSYPLASHCAQFPLPVITGIGHERDNTVLDYVAYYRAKTPTAVADYLVGRLENTYNDLLTVQNHVTEKVQGRITTAADDLKRIAYQLPMYINKRFERENYNLQTIARNLDTSTKLFLQEKEQALQEKESLFKLSSPSYILSRGYSITYKDGKAVRSSEELKPGDIIETVFAEGSVASETVRRK